MILQKSTQINFEELDAMNFDEKSKKLVKEYLKIEAFYKYALREMSARVENLDDYCQMTYRHNPIHHMESRMKAPQSIIEKIQRRGFDYTMESLEVNVYDIAGIRVICNYVSDIYKLLELLSQQSDLKLYLKKDYIANPKDSGYRSVHVIYKKEVIIGAEHRWVPVEIQLRTIAMDMWASLEHELRYKADFNFTQEDEYNIKKYSDDLYKIDLEMQRLFLKTLEKKE